MKLLVATLALAYLAVAAAQIGNPEFEELVKEQDEASIKCREEHNVSAEDLKADFNSDETIEKVKCYYHCMHVKTGVYKDGAFDREAFTNQLKIFMSVDKANALLEACLPTEAEESPCDVANTLTKCFRKETSKSYNI